MWQLLDTVGRRACTDGYPLRLGWAWWWMLCSRVRFLVTFFCLKNVWSPTVHISSGTDDPTEATIYHRIMGADASKLLKTIQVPLIASLKTASMIGEAFKGLESKVAELLVVAAYTWSSSNIPEEAPTIKWLCHYLEKEVAMGMYKVRLCREHAIFICCLKPPSNPLSGI